MNPFTTSLRPSVEPPPLNWLTENPEWWEPSRGRGIRIQLDQEHSDVGRFAGYVSPPSGSSCYMKTANNQVGFDQVCIPTPKETADGFRTFHADTPIIDGVEIGIGSVPLGGGHSDFLSGDNSQEARDWIQRKERWRRLANDLALYGHATHTDDGILLRGWVTPGLSIAEAEMINNTIMSGEWLYDPEVGGVVFVGVIPVRRTALPMRPLPMAASLAEAIDSCGCPMDEVTFLTPPDELWNGAKMDTEQDPPAVEEVKPLVDEAPAPAPVMAGPEEELAEALTRIATLEAQMDEARADLATLSAMAVDDEASRSAGPDTSQEELLERIAKMEETIRDFERVNDDRLTREERLRHEAVDREARSEESVPA